MDWTDWVDIAIKVGSKAFGSGGGDDTPSEGLATRHSAQTKFPMPDEVKGTYGYITGTPYQVNASRQMITQLERLMEPRNGAMQTGVDALANKYVRDAINTANTVSGKKLFGTSVTAGTGSPNISLGSTSV